MVSANQINRMLPGLSYTTSTLFSQYFGKYMAKFNINTLRRVQYFLANVFEESGGLKVQVERLNYTAVQLQSMGANNKSWAFFKDAANAKKFAGNEMAIANIAYCCRNGNGSIESGDGWRYRGRGIMQLTFKGNYEAASKAIYGNNILVEQPDLVALNPEISVAVACWYYNMAGCNKLADAANFTGVVKAINGGTTGLAKRQAFLKLAQASITQLFPDTQPAASATDGTDALKSLGVMFSMFKLFF